MMRRYLTPSAMTSSSGVKMRISCAGIRNAASAKTRPVHSEKRSAMPMTFSMVRVSPLPQYCAVRMAAPLVRPKKNSVMMNWTCPASEEAESTVSPTCPSIMTSAEVTATLMRFCSAIGTTSANTLR